MPLTFTLSADAVSEQLKRQDERARRQTHERAMNSIPAQPLMVQLTTHPTADPTAWPTTWPTTLPIARPAARQTTPLNAAPNASRLSMRFVPPPTASEGGVETPLSDRTLAFASFLAPAARVVAATSAIVERIAPAPVGTVATRLLKAAQTCKRSYVDQFSVPERAPTTCGARFFEVAYATMFENLPDGVTKVDGQVVYPPGKTFSPLLGPTGHYERFNVWTHVFAVVLFVAYAVVRHKVADDDSLEGALTSAAAWAAAFTFLMSSVYHATNPDRELSTLTRILDYFGIYLGIVVTSLADISVVTKARAPSALLLDVFYPLGFVNPVCTLCGECGLRADPAWTLRGPRVHSAWTLRALRVDPAWTLRGPCVHPRVHPACTSREPCLHPQGLVDVPLIAIVDVPAGALIIFVFFLWRRVRLPRHITYESDAASAALAGPDFSGCTIGHGLFSRGHYDQSHGPAREATSLLLALAYFLVVPVAIAVLGWEIAAVVLTLQSVAFLILLFGMVVDRVLRWPDEHLRSGGMRCLVWTACSCVLHSHALWHLLAVVAAVLGAVAREFALHTT